MAATTQKAKQTPWYDADQWEAWRKEWDANQQAQEALRAKSIEQGWKLADAEALDRVERDLKHQIVVHLALRPINPRHWSAYDRQQFAALVAAARLACPGIGSGEDIDRNAKMHCEARRG